MLKAIAAFSLMFSMTAGASGEFARYEIECMEHTQKQVDELAKAGVTLELREVLQIHTICLQENSEPSYEERCGDRRGGAYDNCTN
jgi:hypothetical protein